MASGWLSGEARKAMGGAREIRRFTGDAQVYLHFRRGELKPSPFLEVSGFERVTRIPLPMDKDDADLLEWILHELKGVPCHPVG